MDPDFVLHVKCTIFWLNRGLRVYFDLHPPDFPKSTSKYLVGLITFLVQNIQFWRRLWFNNHSNNGKHIFEEKKVNFCQQYVDIISLEKCEWLRRSEYFIKNHCIAKVSLAVKHLRPYFLTIYKCTKQGLRSTFWKSSAYKSKHTLKPLLSQNMVHFTWTPKSGSMDKF